MSSVEEEVNYTLRKEEVGGSVKAKPPKTAANAETAELSQRAGT